MTISRNLSLIADNIDSSGLLSLTTGVTGTLPIANGGTGAASLTGYGALVMNSAGTAATSVAPGTVGNLLTSNGTSWASSAPPTSMVYPGAGIPNSTGTAWGTSYSTTGSGAVVLDTSPTLVTPVLGTPSSGTLTNCTFPTLNQNTSGTAGGLSGTPNITVGTILGGNTQISSLGINTAASGTAGEIRATNNITAYYSDERLKTKISDIEDPLGKIRQIKTMLYHANELAVSMGYDASIEEVGVTAQSVQAVQPQAVAPAPIDENYLTVRYERLVPLLIEAIKALDLKVDLLIKGS
jgi:hypothetical protein